MTDDLPQVPKNNQDTPSESLPVLESVHPDDSQPPAHDLGVVNVMQMAILVEGGIAFLALLLAYFLNFFDTSQPLSAIGVEQWKTGAVWGVIGTVPMLLYLAVYIRCPPKILQPMREFVETQLRPLFADSSLLKMLIIALLAGFCEELFFRWCLQGGITSVTGSLIVGLVVASVIFGLCHWVNASYGITTLFIGMYLGLLMIWSNTWLAPAIAHALFDFIALIYIARFPIRQ